MRRDELIFHQALISQEMLLIHLQSLPIGVSPSFSLFFRFKVSDRSAANDLESIYTMFEK